MAKTYPTKFFSYEMEGASQTGDSSAGTMIKILKECLVTGFGTNTPLSIVWDETFGWAKATFEEDISYMTNSVIMCSGATPVDYNGEHRIMRKSTKSIWFELDDGVVPTAAAVGTLEIKIAPLGWEIMFADENEEIIIFKTKTDEGNVHLRIDNTAFSGWKADSTYKGRLAKVAMVENVVDLYTYDVIYEHRWYCTGYASGHKWDLVGNGKIFFYLPEYGKNKRQAGYVAGYIDSIRPGDRYHFIMNRTASTDSNSSNYYMTQDNYAHGTRLGGNFTTDRNILARQHHQLQGTTGWHKSGLRTYNSDVMLAPNPVDNGFYINTDPAMILESSNAYRGHMPIMVFPLSNHTAYNRKVLQNLPEFPGKIFRMLSPTYDTKYSALMGFDISTVEE